MPVYKNIANHVVIIRGTNGLLRIQPGAEIELETGVAHRGRPFLREVSRQLIVEQPNDLVEADEEKTLEEQVVVEEAAEEETAVEEEAAVEEQASDNEYDLSLLDLSVSKLRKAIADVDDPGYLEALIEAEKAGKTRSSAIEVLSERLAEVTA